MVPYAPTTIGPLCFGAPPLTFFHYENDAKVISDLKLNSRDVLPQYSLSRVSNTQPPSDEFNLELSFGFLLSTLTQAALGAPGGLRSVECPNS